MAASFYAELTIEDHRFPVLTCEYQLSQPTDQRGRPLAGVRGGLIRLTVTGNSYRVLTKWAVDPFKALNGRIIFYDRKGATLKTLSFTQGYCVSYREMFVPHDGDAAAYTFDLGLSAAKVSLNGTLHDNQWLDWKLNN